MADLPPDGAGAAGPWLAGGAFSGPTAGQIGHGNVQQNYFQVPSPPPPAPLTDLDRAVAALAAEVERQWAREAWQRQVIQPVPLRVRWSSTRRPVAAARDVVVDGAADTDWTALPLRGDVDSVAAAFNDLPHRQLVVLGEPGAGKTVLAMLLTLHLLKLREGTPAGPVPVLFPIASWNPDAEQVEMFLARRLAEEYPILDRRDDQGRRLAELLVGQGRVVPVLDGLDELPTGRHTAAVEALDRFTAPGPFAERGRPLVLTCRSREYEQAVTRSGQVLARAAVVEIEPVDVEQAIAFLSHPAPARPRWAAVFARLRADPDGPLARVLSTPLMVGLARTAFQAQSSSPTTLLGMSEEATIAGRLIDGFLTGIYQPDQPVPPGTRPSLRPRVYRPEQATRWLSCLAFQMGQAGTRDLSWWQLTSGPLSSRSRPSRRPGRRRTQDAATAVVAVLAGLAALPAGAGLALRVGFVGAVVVGPNAAGMFRSLWPTSYPPQVLLTYHSRRRLRARRQRVCVLFAVWYGLAVALLLDDLAVGITGSVVCAAAAAVTPPWSVPFRRGQPRRTTPRLTLRANHIAAATAAVQYGLTGEVVFTLAAAALPGHHHDLTAGAVAGSVFALAAAFAAGLWTWISFRLTHLQLVLRGQLPPRLWVFLDDAHRRGTLRQSGTVWQFRHALLQDHLATTTAAARLRSRAGAGDYEAVWRLATLLVEQGRVAEAIVFLRGRADAGDTDSAWQLADLLAAHGRVEDAITVLRGRADTGDGYATRQLADLLAAHGRVEELRARADTGDGYATRQLAELLAAQGRVDDAITLLQARADTGGGDIRPLADLLVRRGRVDDAITLLRARADTGDVNAAWQLADVLARQGRVDDAIRLLQARADAGDRSATRRLADLLARQGHTDDALAVLRARADAGDPSATRRLADLLAEQGRVAEAIVFLQDRADAGDTDSAWQLADLLAEHGRVEEAITVLRARADAGDSDSAWQLADLLAEQGRVADAVAFLRARADAGDKYAVRQLADLLVRHGRQEEAIAVLRARADAGDGYATRQLASLLAQQGRHEEAIAVLRARADAGDRYAQRQLTVLLADRRRG